MLDDKCAAVYQLRVLLAFSPQILSTTLTLYSKLTILHPTAALDESLSETGDTTLSRNLELVCNSMDDFCIEHPFDSPCHVCGKAGQKRLLQVSRHTLLLQRVSNSRLEDHESQDNLRSPLFPS